MSVSITGRGQSLRFEVLESLFLFAPSVPRKSKHVCVCVCALMQLRTTQYQSCLHPLSSHFIFNEQKTLGASTKKKHHIPRRCQRIKYVDWWRHLLQVLADVIMMWCVSPAPPCSSFTEHFRRLPGSTSTWLPHSINLAKLQQNLNTLWIVTAPFYPFTTVGNIIVDNGICKTGAKYSIKDYPYSKSSSAVSRAVWLSYMETFDCLRALWY